MPAFDVRSKRLDHLGIVAGICHRIGLINEIDQRIPTKRQVSVGQATQSMILNGLGFTGRAMYLTPEFFEEKPLERLIGPGIGAEDLNDDCLGRTLDDLHAFGLTEIFADLAAKACAEFGIKKSAGHLDSSSFSFSGKYEKDFDENTVKITYGWSKDGCPDLKQVIVLLLCHYKSNIPMWFKGVSGNTSDKISFGQSIEQFSEQLMAAPIPYVTIYDSAGYTAANIQKSQGKTYFLARVPATITEVQDLYAGANLSAMQKTSDPRYSYTEHQMTYADIKQRWLLVHSTESAEASVKTLQKKVDAERKRLEVALAKQSQVLYDCDMDALSAMEIFAKPWIFHHVSQFEVIEHKKHLSRGRPKKDAPARIQYSVNAQITPNEEAYRREYQKSGLFVLATDAPDSRLSAIEMLEDYKSQGSSVERGFRFLKDPTFFANGLYFHNPKRVVTMLMVMTLCLLVYALAEHHLRAQLKTHNEFVPDQTKKPTQKITMRRVFQMFEGIEVLFLKLDGKHHTQVANLKPVHLQILRLLGPHCQMIYGLSS